MEWVEVIDAVEHRLGMFTGLPTYERAVSLVLGFDLGAGTDICERLQRRARTARRWVDRLADSSPVGGTDTPRPDERALTPTQNEAAIKLLAAEVRAVLDATKVADGWVVGRGRSAG